MQCLHAHNLSQALIDQCKTSCDVLEQHRLDQGSECLPGPSYLRIFFIIFIVTFLIGLLKVLIIRQVVLQWSSNRIKSSSDYRLSASTKDKLILQSVCTRAVTYRREKPEEIKMDISKLDAHEAFRCSF